MHEIAPWESILGKTLPKEYPLVRHLLDTSAVIDAMWSSMLSNQQKDAIVRGMGFQDGVALSSQVDVARDVARYLGGMHDMGKAVSHWQRKTLRLPVRHASLLDTNGDVVLPMPDLEISLADHSLNSQYYFRLGHSVVFTDETSATHSSLLRSVRNIVAGHHGVFRNSLDDSMHSYSAYLQDPDQGLPWLEAQRDIERHVLSTLDITPERILQCVSMNDEAAFLLTGLVIFADWVASTASFIEDVDIENRDYAHHYRDSVARTHALIERNGIEKPVWTEGLSWETMFPQFSSPNDLQSSVIRLFEDNPAHGNGMLLISAPMGSGKTEASLYASSMLSQRSGGSGLWVTLPTKATSDAIFERATDIANRVFEGDEHTVALMHSDASISAAIEKVGFTSVQQDSCANPNKKFAINPTEIVPNVDEGGYGQGENGDTTLFISEFLLEKRVGGMANIAVGTIDQALKAALKLKHNALRWLTLSGKSIILDEIHDYDQFTFTIIKRFIRWCGTFHIPLVAMSATLSVASQKEIVSEYCQGMGITKRDDIDLIVSRAIPEDNLAPGEFPGITSPGWSYINNAVPADRRRITIADVDEIVTRSPVMCPAPSTPYDTTIHSSASYSQSVLDITAEVMDKKGMALCVCNTVTQSVGVYNMLKKNLDPSIDLRLLHSRMPQERKQEIITELLDKTGKPNDGNRDKMRKPYILVATQIVQQSMDIDFDVLVTPLAPLPELFQRIGRVYRHEQGDRRAVAYRDNPQVHIVVEEGVASWLTTGVVRNTADATNSVIPYCALGKDRDVVSLSWGCLSALEVLNRELHFDYGKTSFQWDAKGRIHACFAEYSTLWEEARLVTDGSDTKMLTLHEAFKERSVLDGSKEDSASLSIIAEPPRPPSVSPFGKRRAGTWMMSEVTSRVTETSKNSPATRDIQESAVVLPVYGDVETGYFLDEEHTERLENCNGKGNIKALRAVGSKVISVPERTRQILAQNADKREVEHIERLLPRQVFPVLSENIQKLGYTNISEYGMLKPEMDNNTLFATWL